MPQKLYYGPNLPLEFDLGQDTLLAELSSPGGAPLVDPAAAVAAALADPLDFPPLAAAAVPGDRVAIALQRAVPQAAAVVAGIVHVLLESGVTPGDVTIVFGESGAAGDPDPTAFLPEKIRREIGVESHDTRTSNALAYLAATRDGRPIYINRTVCDADVVVPVGSARLEAHPDYVGVHGSLFPAFADHQTRRRFTLPAPSRWAAHQRHRRDEADEAAWLLGVQFTVQVVPGGSDSLLHVLAGEASAVARRAQELGTAAWQQTVPARASLVVAAIDGNRQHQTWENVGRALYAASRVVSESGDIVVCSDVRQSPGKVLRKAAAPHVPDYGHSFDLHEPDEEEVQDAEPEAVGGDDSSQALSACMLSGLLERNRIYLLSGLDENVVEDLGMAYVEESQDVARLASRHDSCILLSHAQYALPSVEE